MLNTWLYAILGAIVIIAILVAVIKYPSSRVYVFTFLSIGLICLTIYSGINLNYYYTEQGGIFGYIDGIFDTNSVEVEELTIKLDNIEMIREHEDSSIYSAEVLTQDVMAIDNEVNYSLFINGQPLSKVEYSTDYVIAEYDYIFMDEKKEILLEDTLFIRFAFYSNSTLLSVSTSGGEEAVKYWNYYFNKNTFIIDFKQSDYYRADILDKEEILLVSFYGEKGLFKKQYSLAGQRIYMPTIEESFWKFLGWSLDGNTVVDYSYFDIEENTTYYALFDEVELGTLGQAKIESDIYIDLRADIVRFPQSIKIAGYEVVTTADETYLTTYISVREGNPAKTVLYVVNYENISTIADIETAEVRMVSAGTVEDIEKFGGLNQYLEGSNLTAVENGIETIAEVDSSNGVFVKIEVSNRKGNFIATINYIVLSISGEIITGSEIREGSEYNLAYADLLLKVFGGN